MYPGLKIKSVITSPTSRRIKYLFIVLISEGTLGLMCSLVGSAQLTVLIRGLLQTSI